ncbi:MAG: hypothetical protein EYC70_02695 [Planctomycetota bacterium]|nr:MAG: hypothetical protein EYC70_02695 [Planctomycetota bacterium]
MPDGSIVSNLLGPQYPALPKWAFEIEYCPRRAEEHKPVGKFAIYAYLSVLEPVKRTVTTVDAQGRTVTTTVEENREHKVLPVRFEETFQVDFSDSPFSNDEVEHGLWGAPPRSYSPIPVSANQFTYGKVTVAPDPPGESGTTLKATTTFSWHQGVIVASATPSGQIANPPIIGPLSGAAQVQSSAGPVPTLAVGWILAVRSYRTWVADFASEVGGTELPLGVDELLSLAGEGGGRSVCSVTVNPVPNTTLADAKEVYQRHYVGPP